MRPSLRPSVPRPRHGAQKPSIVPADRHVHHNLILGNYNSQEAIDTDDGTAYLRIHDNFLAYASNGLKSDFGGHDEVYTQNILAYVGTCTYSYRWVFYGYNDGFYNNTCVFRDDKGYASDCFAEGQGHGWEVHSNRVFSSTGNVTVCEPPDEIPLQDWLAQGHDKGTTIAAWPADDTLIAWGKAMLGM